MTKGIECLICAICIIPMMLFMTPDNFGWWFLGTAGVAAIVMNIVEVIVYE